MHAAIAIWLAVYYLVLALALLVTRKPKPAPVASAIRYTRYNDSATRAPGIR